MRDADIACGQVDEHAGNVVGADATKFLHMAVDVVAIENETKIEFVIF